MNKAPAESGTPEHRIRDESDFDAQKQYIAKNPERKGFAAYPHVHTAAAYSLQVDASPFHNTPREQDEPYPRG